MYTFSRGKLPRITVACGKLAAGSPRSALQRLRHPLKTQVALEGLSEPNFAMLAEDSRLVH